MTAKLRRKSRNAKKLIMLALTACIASDEAAAFTLPTPSAHASPSSWLHSSTDRGYETPIDISETSYRDIPSLEQWAYDYGIQRHEGHRLASYDANGVAGSEVYAMTDRDVRSGTCVLCVPRPLIFSANAAMEELRSHDMDAAEKILFSVNADSEIRQYYLMVKILVEYEKGADSPWFPWLNSLPRYYTNAASMTPFCCLCLPSLMRKLTVKERGNMARLSVSSIKLIPFLNEDTKYDVDLCNWIYQIVYTRSFETEDGDLKIVPMGDMFNHGSDYTEIEPSYDEEGNYCAYTTYDVAAGSPLRTSYGDPTNPSHLFARYGFLDDMTPSTFCKIIPAHINKDMEELGYAENKMLFYKNGDVSPEVWDNLLYQHLSSTNIRDRRALMEAHKAEDHAGKQQLHETYYQDMALALENHINGFIEQLDKLGVKTEGRSVEEHPRLPLIWKHNQFVRDTFMTVRMKNFGY